MQGLIILSVVVLAGVVVDGTPVGSCSQSQYLQDSHDCGIFYQCNSVGVAIKMNCPAGLHFNINLHVCDWPQQANCVPPGSDSGSGSDNKPEKKYYLVTESVSWWDAFHACRRNGSFLLSMETKEEEIHVVDLIKESASPSLNWWTSGNNLALNTTYIWSSTGKEYDYKNWNVPTKEPNNLGDAENCMELRLAGNTNWNDLSCKHPLPYICETLDN